MLDHDSFDWSYHGLAETEQATWRILVEPAEFGPTERYDLAPLRELRVTAPGSGGFSWGYNGGGPGRAARVILADALQVSSRWDVPEEQVTVKLRDDFMWDVVSQLTHEWRLRRSAILRWVRGWYADKGIAEPPRAAAGLPPASPYDYEHQRRRTP